jgi:hypothetical protein
MRRCVCVHFVACSEGLFLKVWTGRFDIAWSRKGRASVSLVANPYSVVLNRHSVSANRIPQSCCLEPLGLPPALSDHPTKNCTLSAIPLHSAPSKSPRRLTGDTPTARELRTRPQRSLPDRPCVAGLIRRKGIMTLTPASRAGLLRLRRLRLRNQCPTLERNPCGLRSIRDSRR